MPLNQRVRLLLRSAQRREQLEMRRRVVPGTLFCVQFSVAIQSCAVPVFAFAAPETAGVVLAEATALLQ
jgi:hypothetical protein